MLNRRSFIRTTALSGVGATLFSSDVFSWTGKTPRPARLAYLSHSPAGVTCLPILKWQETMLFTSVDDKAFCRLLRRDDIDAIVVDVLPSQRTPIALAAMEAGKCTAFTEPVAHTVRSVQQIAAMYAQTGTPCLLLDNECFGRDALAVSSMARQHQFGPLTHVACGTDSLTNGLGLAMELLAINRGNRFVSLNASVSQSWGLYEPIASVPTGENESIVKQYQLGEVMTINLQCQNGETVTVNRDLTGKRPYARGYRVQGTKGFWMEDNDLLSRQGQDHSFTAIRPPFDHPFWQPNQAGIPTQPNALSSFVTALQTHTITPANTFDALTIPLVYAIAKSSLAVWNDNINIPDWFSNVTTSA